MQLNNSKAHEGKNILHVFTWKIFIKFPNFFYPFEHSGAFQTILQTEKNHKVIFYVSMCNKYYKRES